MVNDHNFGPVVACGPGGRTELPKDVAVRLTPVTDIAAHEMVRSLASFPLLAGTAGKPNCDIDALERLLMRVSAMVDAHPEIAELDLNPVIATPDGVLIVDAQMRVEPAPPLAPMPSLSA